MGKNRNEVTKETLDPQTQAFLDKYRQMAMDRAGTPSGVDPGMFTSALGFGSQTGLGGIDAYQDPYQQQVIGGVQADFDRQRLGATNAARAEATRAGAYGGSRASLLQASALGDVNRAETSTLANLRSQGFNQSADRLLAERQRQTNLGFGGLRYLDDRAQAQLQGLLPGLQYGNRTTTKQLPYNDFKDLLGLGIGAIGAFKGIK